MSPVVALLLAFMQLLMQLMHTSSVIAVIVAASQ